MITTEEFSAVLQGLVSKAESRAKEHDEGPLDAAACSRLLLQVRFHDPDHGWQEWETIDGRRLEEKYGTTPDQWKLACAGWIEIGGRYEYRVLRVTVTKTIDWSISFAENDSAMPTASGKHG